MPWSWISRQPLHRRTPQTTRKCGEMKPQRDSTEGEVGHPKQHFALTIQRAAMPLEILSRPHASSLRSTHHNPTIRWLRSADLFAHTLGRSAANSSRTVFACTQHPARLNTCTASAGPRTCFRESHDQVQLTSTRPWPTVTLSAGPLRSPWIGPSMTSDASLR